MKVVIVGFGNSTQFFHAPLVLSSSSLDLFGVVSTKPKQTIQEKLGQEVVVFETFDKAIENVNEFDVVIIATPNEFHFPMAKTSMEKGKHVVIEKPLTVTTKEADELIEIAKKNDVMLSCFQNRQWDADFLTLRKALPKLGELTVYRSVWQRYRPNIKDNWRWKENVSGGGLLLDLGSHMAFQVISLFGLPDSVTCFVKNQRGGVDDCFLMILGFNKYPELLVELESSCIVPVADADAERLFFVHGKGGSFEKKGMDVQEKDMRQGKKPTNLEEWGVDKRNAILTLVKEGKAESVEMKCERGNYLEFYEKIGAHLKDSKNTEPPITAKEARDVIRLLEIARESSDKKQTIQIKW